jgi:hypothetical protein
MQSGAFLSVIGITDGMVAGQLVASFAPSPTLQISLSPRC